MCPGERMTGTGEGRGRAVVWWYKRGSKSLSDYGCLTLPDIITLAPRTANAVSSFKCVLIYLSFKTPSNHWASWQQILMERTTLQRLLKGDSWLQVSMGRWACLSCTYRTKSTENSHQVSLFITKCQTSRAHFFFQRMNLLSVQIGQHPFLLRILPWSGGGKKERPEFNVKKQPIEDKSLFKHLLSAFKILNNIGPDCSWTWWWWWQWRMKFQASGSQGRQNHSKNLSCFLSFMKQDTSKYGVIFLTWKEYGDSLDTASSLIAKSSPVEVKCIHTQMGTTTTLSTLAQPSSCCS